MQDPSAKPQKPTSATHEHTRGLAMVAEVDGPATALAIVDSLDLDTHHLFHAIRADLLRRLGRNVEAIAAYQKAIDRTNNTAERDYLQRNRQTLNKH